VTDETWNRALDCAFHQFESYHRQGQLNTPAERKAALADALQHAVGIIRVSEMLESTSK
jgi:hypothetical protein